MKQTWSIMRLKGVAMAAFAQTARGRISRLLRSIRNQPSYLYTEGQGATR
jgi:hypothetical protein